MLNLHEIEKLQDISKIIRKDVVIMAYDASSSHVGTALSMIDILVVLYYKILKINANFPNENNRDKFILSKGHGVSGLYAVLANRGFFSKDILKLYDKEGSPIGGHPKRHSVPGIETSTGSLGHGLALGCGIALGDKTQFRSSKTVVLMGDGECNEGSVWEAAMFASSKKLNNLIAIIDNNKLQGYGRVENVAGTHSIAVKWRAFGWNVVEIDGHDYSQIFNSIVNAYNCEEIPTAIIAHTVKGRGVSFMEDRLEWHYKSPNQEQLNLALKELD